MTASEGCWKVLKERYGYDNTLIASSHSAAMEMAMSLIHLQPNDEVIIPSFYSAKVAHHLTSSFGVKLSFAESEPNCPNVLVSDVLEKITEQTKAIIIMHYAGIPIDVKPIIDKTKQSKIQLIEDCLHGLDSMDTNIGDYIGKSGCVSVFSFNHDKYDIEDGGLLVVNDETLLPEALLLHQKVVEGTGVEIFHEEKKGNEVESHYEEKELKFAMSDNDTNTLLMTLSKLDEIQHTRASIWDKYHKDLLINNIFRTYQVFNIPPSYYRANAHTYYLRFRDENKVDEFCEAMDIEGIQVFKKHDEFESLHNNSSFFCNETTAQIQEQPSCSSLWSTNSDEDTEKTSYPCAEKWSKILVRLPLDQTLSAKDQDRIISAINTYTAKNGLLYIECKEKHWESIRLIRNNNSLMFTTSHQITKEEHWKFMTNVVNKRGKYFVVTQNGECICFLGTVGKDFRLGVANQGVGVAIFGGESYMNTIGVDVEMLIYRKNLRCMFFSRKFDIFPEKKSFLSGENPVLCIHKSKGEVLDLVSDMRLALYDPIIFGQMNLWKLYKTYQRSTRCV